MTVRNERVAHSGEFAEASMSPIDRIRLLGNFRHQDRFPFWSPIARASLNDARNSRAASTAPPLLIEIPRSQGEPIPLDQELATDVTKRAVSLGIVNVSSIRVADAVLHGDRSRTL